MRLGKEKIIRIIRRTPRMAGLALVWALTQFASPLFAEGLDQEAVHAVYLDGDLDQARKTLEGYRDENPEPPFGERLFIAKHLGVIYAARPDTREKAKTFFRELLTLDAGAKIVDMYPSDEILKLFRGIEEEMIADGSTAQGEPAAPALPIASGGIAATAPHSRGSGDSGTSLGAWFRSVHPGWWAAAGLGAATLVTAAALASGSGDPDYKVISEVTP